MSDLPLSEDGHGKKSKYNPLTPEDQPLQQESGTDADTEPDTDDASSGDSLSKGKPKSKASRADHVDFCTSSGGSGDSGGDETTALIGPPARKYGTRNSLGSSPKEKVSDVEPVSHGLCGTNTLVYCSHFLSAWGDQMWTFAVGLYLVIIMPDTLRLTAIFGLTMGASVLLLGPIIGDWVDNSARLRAAQMSLILQNVLVVLCAAIIYVFLVFRDELNDIGGWTEYVSYALMIFFASAANLATIANTITIQRDWIVEICGQDEDQLATMTAIMRAIDLTTQVIAPIATGQIMTYAGNEFGCVFIASWNVCSVVVEYFLIWRVYQTVPALRKKKELAEKKEQEKNGHIVKPDLMRKRNSFTASFQRSLTQARANSVKGTGKRSFSFREDQTDVESNFGGSASVDRGNARVEDANDEPPPPTTCSDRFRILSGITIIIEGWKTYARYEVMLSGLALAFLFMTVLAFHNVTVGYAQIQGLSESVIGIMMGGAGICGILGTLMYPLMHRWWGLPRTGMIALTVQSMCLALCVISVWLPGSPFDLFGDAPLPDPTNCTNLTDIYPSYNESSVPTVVPTWSVPINITCPEPAEKSYVSVGVLMAGIISARFGLWIVDLAITQMFMETVKETERGIVNGVQNSLNQMMEMIKYGLVVALPLANQFGLLVLLSFSSVLIGWFLYGVFLCRLPPGTFSEGTWCGGARKKK